MSVVIVGGNECMVRQYKELCSEYQCKAKIYPKMAGNLKNIGLPDLLVRCPIKWYAAHWSRRKESR